MHTFLNQQLKRKKKKRNPKSTVHNANQDWL